MKMMNSLDSKDKTFSGDVFVHDCRKESGIELTISLSETPTFDSLRSKLSEKLGVGKDDTFVITTTNREEINGDETWRCIQDGDMLYILTNIDQELVGQTREMVNFLPHYDTIVKGGMYEYYASEGHNPLPYAFAELIDNALAATVDNLGPRNIEMRLILDEETPNKNMIIFLDNGKGMTSRQLNNWAIYRLSKFIRKDSKGLLSHLDGRSERELAETSALTCAPRSLNSDISYFGVGGKQAIFFIGNSTRMISKPRGYPDVHELTISKEDFEQKEKNKEAIYSGWIRNRKPGDTSHIKDEEEILKKLISEEVDRESFTAVIITGVNLNHVSYLRSHVKEWTRQLAHIYHYYIHGPMGNIEKMGVTSSETPVDDGFSKINIEVHILNRHRDQPIRVINLRDIDDDMQTQFIRTSSSMFEFKASVEGAGVVEGVLRYHPFLYETETYPKQPVDTVATDETEEDQEELVAADARPARGRRPIFECYWNGRLIPYTAIEDFEWCSTPKKSKAVPLECYNRVSGVLWTNDKFQVSTNKLTFIDLEMKLRDKNTAYTRIVIKEPKKHGKKQLDSVQEKRTDIGRDFLSWLKSCHEQCDKQIRFCGFHGVVMRPELPRNRQGPWSIFDEVEWDNHVFKKGVLVRIKRVVPIVYGAIERFYLYGEHDGDLYATGGEVEVHLEPRSLYDDLKVYPLNKVDRTATLQSIKKFIYEEEAKLPEKLILTWPNGDEVLNGAKLPAGSTIGDMQIEISNRKGELVSKLPGSKQKKLMIELKVIYHADGGDQLVAQHISQHGKTWPYWFHKMENLKSIGPYSLSLQATLNESGVFTVAGHELPSLLINFSITEAEPQRFSIGFLEGPFRIGSPFQIPLEFQDEYGHSTKPSSTLKPELSASGLEISYADKQVKGSSMILKDIIALGSVPNGLGKNFSLVVRIPGLPCDSNTLKIRMLPGVPAVIVVTPEEDQVIENGGTIQFQVAVEDQAGNPTSGQKMALVCKFFGAPGLSPVTVDCVNSTMTISSVISIKKMNSEMKLTAKIEATGVKGVPLIERSFRVKPSQRPATLEVFYQEGAESVPIKAGQDIIGVCGELIKGLMFVIKNEAGGKMKINEDLAAKIKVNWTPKLSRESVMTGRLPDVKVSTLVTETKYCQVSISDVSPVELGFNVRGTPGEPTQIKCILRGSNKVRLSEKLEADILVLVKDKHGNEIKKFEKGVLKDLEISCEGLLVEETVRMLGQTSGFNIHNIRFESGALGMRELRIRWGALVDNVRIEVIAGPPAKVALPGWDLSQPITVSSGAMLPHELVAQLCDEADNPTSEENIRVTLVRDGAFKLHPSSPNQLKTDRRGSANFGVLTVSGNTSGDYELLVKAFVNRSMLLSPPLLISIQPDLTKPVSLDVEYEKNAKAIVGEILTDFQVMVLAESESPLLNAKASCLTMKIWKASEGPRPSPLALIFVPDKNSPANEGKFYFRKRRAPEQSGMYNVLFIYTDGAHEVRSCLISVDLTPGIPIKLAPLQPPGMPTVSNSKSSASRSLIRSMQLLLKDRFDNPAGMEASGKVLVELVDTSETSELPKLAGNTTSLRITLTRGFAVVQNINIQESSPGKDGQIYTLRFSLEKCDIPNIAPYDLQFLFYNDLKKQSEMASLSKEREVLSQTVETYRMMFDTSNQLIEELRAMLNDVKANETRLRMDLRRIGILDSHLTPAMLDSMIQSKENARQLIAKRPRRQCTLPPASADPEVLGKIGFLAEVVDTDIARVLSWHMSADMDCVVTKTTKKAKVIYHQSQGKQQVLPLDSIYHKALPDWSKPLPHEKFRPNWHPSGNPVYVRNLLRFTSKDVESCRTVFGMLLGETLILDTLDDASAYRQEIVKFTHCPTILTRTGDRIRSNGKFGGLLNKALPIDKLRGAIFGEPMPPEYDTISQEIASLQNYKTAMEKRREVERDLNEQLVGLNAPDMKAKQRDYHDAEQRLKNIEQQLGVASSTSHLNTSLPVGVPSSASVKEQRSSPSPPLAPQSKSLSKPRGRRSAPGNSSVHGTPAKRQRRV